ncbi:hypothetical protein BDQ12DRAFT_721979 [Crucibulum laeve]|uniref:Uncharacterized protein n=1 Tax=Crucibulum laeve TaxID=68775 RepID=A0A5C3M557_9AGAR|nr:hypothetical protein BDQ12DRAFT_721979 [Crucibulum laeve]
MYPPPAPTRPHTSSARAQAIFGPSLPMSAVTAATTSSLGPCKLIQGTSLPASPRIDLGGALFILVVSMISPSALLTGTTSPDSLPTPDALDSAALPPTPHPRRMPRQPSNCFRPPSRHSGHFSNLRRAHCSVSPRANISSEAPSRTVSSVNLADLSKSADLPSRSSSQFQYHPNSTPDDIDRPQQLLRLASFTFKFSIMTQSFHPSSFRLPFQQDQTTTQNPSPSTGNVSEHPQIQPTSSHPPTQRRLHAPQVTISANIRIKSTPTRSRAVIISPRGPQLTFLLRAENAITNI